MAKDRPVRLLQRPGTRNAGPWADLARGTSGRAAFASSGDPGVGLRALGRRFLPFIVFGVGVFTGAVVSLGGFLWPELPRPIRFDPKAGDARIRIFPVPRLEPHSEN